MEVIRDHFRSLSDVDFKGTLLGKYVADSLDAVCRVLLHELKHRPEGAETFLSTIEDDLKSQITWMSGLFPAGGSSRKRILKAGRWQGPHVAARSLLLSTGGCAWIGCWSGDRVMKSTSPTWVWVALVLALLMIGYVVTPPVVTRQAAALWGLS
jgi:hypothetical protein